MVSSIEKEKRSKQKAMISSNMIIVLDLSLNKDFHGFVISQLQRSGISRNAKRRNKFIILTLFSLL